MKFNAVQIISFLQNIIQSSAYISYEMQDNIIVYKI